MLPHSIPIRALPPSAAQGRQDPTCGLFDILARLGQAQAGTRRRSPAWAARYIQALIDREGFPAPLPILHGDKLCREIRTRSRWQLAAVDAWFDDQAGPAASNHVDAAAARQAAQAMDERAFHLGAPQLTLHQGGRHD
jgi:hypothetical protein